MYFAEQMHEKFEIMPCNTVASQLRVMHRDPNQLAHRWVMPQKYRCCMPKISKCMRQARQMLIHSCPPAQCNLIPFELLDDDIGLAYLSTDFGTG